MQETDIVESHWSNWLASEDVLQAEVTKKYVDYYNQIQRLPDRFLARNTEQLHSQWLYNKYTEVVEDEPGIVEINNIQMPVDAYQNDIIGNMVLKLKLEPNQHITDASINGNLIPSYFEEEGFAFLYLPPLEKKRYTLLYTPGHSLMPVHVFNNGTYNVYSILKTGNQIHIKLKMYGRQTVNIQCIKPQYITPSNSGLIVESYTYLPDSGRLEIDLNAKNMQGTCGNLILQY
jgi:hypothetical protein